MREILFRGKRTDNGEWVYGCLDFNRSKTLVFIRTPSEIHTDVNMVDPATVGQFTGMTDKNGKRIFEGDIVKDHGGVTYPVVWGGTGFYLKYSPHHAHSLHYDLLPLCNYWHAHGAIVEGIGNIHDNPELMER